MDLIYLFRKLVFAQVLLGIVAFCMSEQKPELLLLAGSLAALSWYVVEGPLGRPLPQWAILSGAVGAVGWLALEMGYFRSADPIQAVGHFTLWLQVLQLYAHKNNRDYALLLVLSLLQIIGASTLPGGTSIFFGALLCIYSTLALFTVLIFQFKSTSDQVLRATQAAAPGEVAVERPSIIAGRGLRWHFRGMTAGIGVLCALVALLVFLLLPRAGTNAMAGGDDARALSQVSGFRNTVALTGGTLTLNRDVVMHLRLTYQGAAKESVPGQGLWYLRGASLDTYRPHLHQWTRGREILAYDQTLSVPAQGLNLTEPASADATLEAEITVRKGSFSTLFTLFPPNFVAGDVSSVRFNPQDQQLERLTFTPGNKEDSGGGGYTYRVRRSLGDPVPTFRAYLHREAGDSPVAPAAEVEETRSGDYAHGWRVNLTPIRNLGTQILQSRGLQRDPNVRHDPRDAQIVQSLSDYLSNQFTYTLNNPPMEMREDPIYEFLLHRREGHCELFAAGLAALARAQGLRARVVTGYVASEYNTVGGYYVVRESDAHAWCEMEVAPGVWQRFDPTPAPALRSEHPTQRTWLLSWLRDCYVHLEYTWISQVLAYDNTTRNAMLDQVRANVQAATQDDANWLGAGTAWLHRFTQNWRLDTLGYVLLTGILLAIGMGLLILARIWLVRRRRLVALQLTRLPRAQRRRLVRQLGFYLTMLDMLERHGWHRPSWQSPFAFAQELTRRNEVTFEPVLALTEHFYEVRFGHRILDPVRRRLIRAHLRRLEESLGQGAA